jgi:hypothetical protein
VLEAKDDGPSYSVHMGHDDGGQPRDSCRAALYYSTALSE